MMNATLEYPGRYYDPQHKHITRKVVTPGSSLRVSLSNNGVRIELSAMLKYDGTMAWSVTRMEDGKDAIPLAAGAD
jgi:hypothetical protein